jgi:predicted DNA-binding protein YlxM (UPF0122 family)
MIEELLKRKEELMKERDLCAEIYNIWITKLHVYQKNKEKYELYMKMINNMEPYGSMIKEQIREINKKICEIEGVESIGDTLYAKDCDNKYGFDKPNAN